VFRRRTTTEPAPAESTESTPRPTTPAKGPRGKGSPGKGRPTPKRRDAERARRQRIAAPRDRREAARLARQRARAERAKIQQALITGDERYLPPRDKGPVRRFCRDFVDSRRTLGEYLLPFFLVIFLAMMIPVPQVQLVAYYLWLTAIIIVPVELFILGRRLKRELRARFPNESHRGAVLYGVMRATQIRRLRLPKPQVAPGDTI
jgi:hypothetical protein